MKVWLYLLIHPLLLFGFGWCCNHATCMSIVTKCSLLRSCMCTNNNQTCHMNCFHCLGSSAVDCCNCFEFCSNPDKTLEAIKGESLVNDFNNTMTELFQVLAEDDLGNWESITISTNATETCTAIFLNDCTSWDKCKRTCQTMGAVGTRWFYDGCCECLGKNCKNYGINKNRCRNCPFELKTVDESYEDFEEYQYLDE